MCMRERATQTPTKQPSSVCGTPFVVTEQHARKEGKNKRLPTPRLSEDALTVSGSPYTILYCMLQP